MAAPGDTRTQPVRYQDVRPGRYSSELAWMLSGVGRQEDGVAAALIATWTGVPIALWLAAIGLVGGALAGIFGASQIGLAHALHVDQGVGVVAAFIGAMVGAFEGFLLIFEGYYEHWPSFVGAIVSGIIVGTIVLALLVAVEPTSLKLRGYRSLSRRERERIEPLLQEAAIAMGLTQLPSVWMSDMEIPGAWTHMRAIVLTKGLLDYDTTPRPPQSILGEGALRSILAHELHHWDVADPVGLSAVWAAFWPIIAVYNAGSWLARRGRGLGVVGWIIFWPAWVTTRVVGLCLHSRGRIQEYEADARVAGLGDEYRVGLYHALSEMAAWEKPRTGWEDVLLATHPPIELRLERLEAPAPSELPVEDEPLATGPVVPAPAPPPLPTLQLGEPTPVETPAETPPAKPRTRSGRVRPRRAKSTAKKGTRASSQPASRKPGEASTPESEPQRPDGDGEAAERWLPSPAPPTDAPELPDP